MAKCCAYGIPNDPEGDVIRWVICVDDDQPCYKFLALKSMGSWTVANCSDCKVPAPKPKFRCCAYGVQNDPSGKVVRWRICLPAAARCPEIKGYVSLGSKLVANCKDCCGGAKEFPLKPQLRREMLAALRKGVKTRRVRRGRQARPR